VGWDVKASVPEQGYRAVLGVISLAKKYPIERKRVIALNAYTYSSIKSILEKGPEGVPFDYPQQSALPEHKNVRGAAYYAGKGVMRDGHPTSTRAHAQDALASDGPSIS
jgi:hypothetical protein